MKDDLRRHLSLPSIDPRVALGRVLRVVRQSLLK